MSQIDNATRSQPRPGTAFSIGRVADLGWARLVLIGHWQKQSLSLHDHPAACIHYFLLGNYLETFETDVVMAGPGSILIKECHQPHANLMGAQSSLALRIELRDS